MNYPNRVIKKGETDPKIVKAIQKELNQKRCGNLTIDGDFGSKTEKAVKLFQTRHTDFSGQSLKADGQVGAITWQALFETATATQATPSALLSSMLKIAASQVGVVEQPLNSNRGPEVDTYLRTVGLNPVGNHYSWCAAFVYWCFNEASKEIQQPNPLVKTAGVLDHWQRAHCIKIPFSEAKDHPSLVKVGSVFIIDHGGGMGHTGIVESISGGNLVTIEGNTNNTRSRNGYGVFRLTTRKVLDINKGFLVY